MIHYRPHYIVANTVAHVFDAWQPQNLLPLYEHFARKAIAADLALECFNGCHEFGAFGRREQVEATLARLLASVGTDTARGRFLRACGIRTWRDLSKPIAVAGWDRATRWEFDVRERRLKDSPNPYHPDAVFGQYTSLWFGMDRRWVFAVHYGYSRDSSSWALRLRQNRQESLNHFLARIHPWVESLFEPEESLWRRECANRAFDQATEAVRGVFWNGHSGCSDELVSILLGVKGGGSLSDHRIRLDRRRLATIRRWIAQQEALP